jgi:hypothetical protein
MKIGKLPFWDSTLMSGVPYEPPTYPLRILLLTLIEPIAAHDYFLLLHLFASGFFFYFMLREQAICLEASLLGAVAWMFNSYIMVWFEFEFVSIIAVLLPACILSIDRVLKKPGPVNYMWLTLVFALILASGFYQLTVYTFLFAGIYLLYHLAQQSPGNRVRLSIAIAGLFLIASVIALPFFVPKFLILFNENSIQRTGFSYDEIFNHVGRLLPSQLLMFWFPNLFSNPSNVGVLPFPGQLSFTYNNFNEYCIYTGMTISVLAMTAPIFLRYQDIKFHLICTIVIILMLMGGYWYYPIYLLPGMDLTTPARILIIFSFCICVLAAKSLHFLTQDNVVKTTLVIFWVALALLAILISIALYFGVGLPLILDDSAKPYAPAFTGIIQSHATVILQPVLFLLATIALLYLICWHRKYRRLATTALIFLTLIDLMPFAVRYNTSSEVVNNFPETPMISFLKNDPGTFRTASMGPFLHNYLSTFNIESITGYLSIYPRSHGETLQLTQNYNGNMPTAFSRWLELSYLGHPLLDMMGLKYVVVPSDSTISLPNFTEVYRSEVAIYQNSRVFDRTYFVCTARTLRTEAEMFNTLYNAPTQRLLETVFLYGTSSETTPASKLKEECQSEVELVEYRNGEIVVSVRNQSPGYLVITNQFSQNWQLSDGDKIIPLQRANHTYLAAQLAPGNKTFNLKYVPVQHYWSYVASMVMWSLIGLALFIYFCKQMLSRFSV